MKSVPKKSPSADQLQKSAGLLKEKVIYVIDDNAESVRILESLLKKHCGKIVGFTEPTGAYEQILNEPPDVLLLDVMMPEMDGWVFYTRLRAEPSLAKLPVLFVTCLADHEVEAEMQEDHLCATLPKPFAVSDLIKKVTQLLS